MGSITTKQPGVGMYHGQFSWTWSQAPWIVYVLDHSDNYFGQITLCSAKREQEIIGPRDTIQRVLNSLILCSTSCGRRVKAAIVCKVFSFVIRWEVELDPGWARCSFQRFVRSIQIASWRLSL